MVEHGGCPCNDMLPCYRTKVMNLINSPTPATVKPNEPSVSISGPAPDDGYMTED